jgi:HEAT repeat protein
MELDERIEDRLFARRIVGLVAERGHRRGAPKGTPPTPVRSDDDSFLGRLSPEGDTGGPCIADLDEVSTLIAVLRAGELRQRRAAARQIQVLLERGQLDDSETSAIETALVGSTDADVAFEVSHARAALPGEPGDEARDEEDPWAADIALLESEIAAFWEGESGREPLMALPGEQRAWLAMRARLLPEPVLAHVAAVVEGCDGVSDLGTRSVLLQSLRSAGDPRLVPSLAAVLATGHPDLAPDAARALGRMDDPRARPALLAGLDRCADDRDRVVVLGALGMQGDMRGRAEARRALQLDDRRAVQWAVEALEHLATPEDTQALVALLDAAETPVAAAAARALGRVGDGRALLPLQQRRARAGAGPLATEHEHAVLVLQAQLDLRGERPPRPADASASIRAERAHARVLARGPQPGWWDRLLGRIDFIVGQAWWALGSSARAAAWFEVAAARRPAWAAPVAAVALIEVEQSEPGRALGAFRRAIEVDRSWVESERAIILSFARVALRRAEEMEQAGRFDIACGLLDEVLRLDLRKVPGGLRLEVRRKRDDLAQPSRAR